MTAAGWPRRRVLGVAGLVGAAGLVAACSDEAPTPAAPPAAPTTPSTTPPSTTPGVAAPAYTGDLQVAALAAALANLAASLYADAVGGSSGRSGPLPDVVASFLRGAGAQHAETAGDWNRVLAAGGRPAVTGTPLTVEASRRSALAGAAGPADVLALAVDLETSIAATLVARLPELTDPTALARAADAAPVAAMHAATAAFLLGRPAGTPPGPGAAALDRSALRS